jgi:type IV secretory pathway VirB10-like protein
MADAEPATASVTDHRIAPRGVLPRRMQTWLMVGVAVGILSIIVFTGHPGPAGRPTAPVASTPLAPNPARLRDYQDRLRIMEERARQETLGLNDPRETAMSRPGSEETPAAAGTTDPLMGERRRREYESLFASNVVMSRRPDGQQLATLPGLASQASRGNPTGDGAANPPNIDDVANAVVRATSRYGPGTHASTTTAPAAAAPGGASSTLGIVNAAGAKVIPAYTGPITSTGPMHRLLEGTIVDTVLTNRLDGHVAAPVNCLVTNAVYSHDGQYVLIPAGSRVLGETKPVQSLGETRLAVAFNRVLLPDGRTYRLDQFLGLNEIGDAGLRDQVNHHYMSTFGASAAVGLISGLAQWLGAAGFSRGGGNRTVVIAGNVGDATSQTTGQSMNRLLNRLPTVTIREGHRVKVYLTSDLELPAYKAPQSGNRPLLARTR